LQLSNSNLKLFDFLVVNDSNKVFGGKMVGDDVFFGSIFDIASTGPVGVSLSCSPPKVDILQMQVTPSKPEI